MASADQRVQAILEAGDDPFVLLKLPGPGLDALDRPKWDVDDSTITRQYRRLSLCCHPDKNQTEDAERAFHRLGRARDQLLDRDERTKLLQAMTAELLRNRTRTWTTGLSATDEMTKSRERREEAKRLREEEARRQAALIRMHADERRARLERAAVARHRNASASVEEADSCTACTSTSGTTTDGSRKRPRMSEPENTDAERSSSVVSPGRREEQIGSTTAREHTGTADEQGRASQSRTSRVNAARSKLGHGGHRYDDSDDGDDNDDSSESEGEIMTAAAKARARKKAAGGKRRARSAMFI